MINCVKMSPCKKLTSDIVTDLPNQNIDLRSVRLGGRNVQLSLPVFRSRFEAVITMMMWRQFRFTTTAAAAAAAPIGQPSQGGARVCWADIMLRSSPNLAE